VKTIEIGNNLSSASYQDITVAVIACIISCSGLIVNITKRNRGGKVLFEADAKTLEIFRLVIPLALIASLVLYYMRIGHFESNQVPFYAGCLFVCAGLMLRWVAILSLGDAFKVKVSILKDQVLKTTGVYQIVRHPSYTGLLLYYVGLGLVMQNWACLLVLIIVPFVTVLKRISIEEIALIDHFGERYKLYVSETKKLLPFIF